MNYFILLLRAKKYPIINYQQEYGLQDKTINLAKGEIIKPNRSEIPNDTWIGRRYLGSGRDEKGEYDTISIYLGSGFFKLISKIYEE